MRVMRPTRASLRSLSPEQLLGVSLPDRPLTARDLSGWARRAAASVDLDRLEPFLRFDPAQYARIPLFTRRHWELVAMCWLPGQGTRVHDHGGSSGASLLLSGTLVETSYVIRAGRLRRVMLRRVKAGEAILESVSTIHQVANRSKRPAISLHLYSPPLGEVQVFEARTPAKARAAAEALGLPPP